MPLRGGNNEGGPGERARAASGEKLCCIVLNFGEDEAAWPLVTAARGGRRAVVTL